MPRSVHVPQRQNQTSCLLLEKPPQEVRAQPLTSQNGVASRCGRAAMAENRTMKEKPAVCIQVMARKFVRESIIEDAATRLIVQIMTEVADAHIAPRDAEIASLRAQLDEARARVKTFEMAIAQLPEMPAIMDERAARRRAIEDAANVVARSVFPLPTDAEIARDGGGIAVMRAAAMARDAIEQQIRALLSESKT